MSYLKFERPLMINLQESLQKEMIRTNRSGAYSCTTIVDCNTRKYHGLLVVPVPEMDDDNHVLLSSFDCSVIQHGAAFNLGLHKYQGNTFSPNGHKYIQEFDCNKIPTTTYRVGGVILKRETVFQHYQDRILIRYTLVDAHSATTLQFRPFLAFRSVRQFTHENSVASRDYEEVPNGIRTRMYDGYPYLYMQFSKKGEFVFQPDWYRGIEYPKEQERGYSSNEDLYVPGYFSIPIKKGESIVFAASTSESKPRGLKALFTEEAAERTPRDNFIHCLINAAHQFHVHDKNGERYLLAGYPWFKCRARDTFLSLPGLTLSIDEVDYFEDAMKTATRQLRQFMEEKEQTGLIKEMEQPDVPLWALWAIQQYDHKVGSKACMEHYGKLVDDIIDYLSANKHPIVELDDNGLLKVDGTKKAVTWMNSTSKGLPVVPRTGYVIEINALWYNDLCFAEQLANAKGDNERAARLHDMAVKCGAAFVKTFVNPYGYLYDFVDGDKPNLCVRPNMIFPVAFDYSPLTPEQKRSVLDMCTRELLTPKGLRTLSPKSTGYNPMYVGPQAQRDLAYHQGTAWPWLEGFYIEACLKLYKRSRLSFIQRQMIGYEDEMFNHCIGTLPELFDGNPPFRGRGAISFAANVAEILRAAELLETYNE